MKTIKLFGEEPHNSMRCTTSPNLSDGCPVKTTQGVLNSLLNVSVWIPEKCFNLAFFVKLAWGNGSEK